MSMEASSSFPSAEERWTSLFKNLCERIGPCFARSETREGVQAYLRGLLSPVERKKGWQLAEEAGLSTPYAMQYLLNRAVLGRWGRATRCEIDCKSMCVR